MERGKREEDEGGKGRDVGSDKEETNMQKVQRQHEESVEEDEMVPPLL